MAKMHRHLAWLTGAANTIATLFPAVWTVILGAAGATALTLWAAGLQWIESPAVHSVALLLVAFLWTFIGVVWLTGHRKPIQTFPVRDYRYGLTFQGIFANLDLRHDEAALQMSITIQNY